MLVRRRHKVLYQSCRILVLMLPKHFCHSFLRKLFLGGVHRFGETVRIQDQLSVTPMARARLLRMERS